MCLQCGRPGFYPRVRKIPWGREWQPTPVFLPGEFHGQKLQSMGLQKVRHNWATNMHILWSPRAVSRFLGSHWGRLRQPSRFTQRAPPLSFIRFPHRTFFFKKVRGSNILKGDIGTSLVVQWLRIHLPMQGTQVRSLVGEVKSHTPWVN